MSFKITKLKSFQFLFAGVFLIMVVGGFSVLKKDKVEPIEAKAEIENVVTTEPSSELNSDVPEVIVSEEIPVIPSVQNSPTVEASSAPTPVLSATDVFSQCLTNKGAKLFGASWCPHCQAQKKAFGESFQYVNYIECADNNSKTQVPVCQQAGISGYPTWRFADGSEILGQATFEQLNEKTGCLLP